MALSRLKLVIAILAVLVIAPLESVAQVRVPGPPDSYQATVHYRIRADRNERIRQFEKMQDYFDSLGFAESLNDESDLAPFDATFETMPGKIAGKNARKLLNDPRVLSLLLLPSQWPMPEDLSTRAKVRIELERGLPIGRQRDLWFQVRARLELMGYEDFIGYDTEKFSVLRGTIPVGTLTDLLQDIRGLPGGWLLPETSYELLPEPLRSTSRAIHVVEVTPDPADAPAPSPPPAILPPVPADKPHLAKLAPEVREILADPASAALPLRVEVGFDNTVNMTGRAWRKLLLDVYGNLAIEGQLGPIVTLYAPKGVQVADIAMVPQILYVRLPRNGAPVNPNIGGRQLPPPKEEPKREEPKKDAIEPVQFVESFDALAATKLSILHAQGLKGDRVRVAVIDTDFAGYPRFMGTGGPLAKAKFIDLTAERSFTIEPDPMPHDAPSMGHGTHMALGVHYAAPGAEITMIRVDGSAPHQVFELAQAIMGESKLTEALLLRYDELRADTNYIARRREIVNADYEKAFNNFEDSDEARAARKAALDAVAELTRMEQEFKERVDRLTKLQKDVAGLEGTQVVVSPLVWNTGQAIDGFSPLSQYLDRTLSTRRVPLRPNVTKVRKVPIWFQAAGDTRGQGWTGLYQDRDGNGVMEFCPDDGSPIPPEKWTRELNFLAFQKDDGSQLPELAANTRIRLAIQWRESHDPDLPDEQDSYYRQPLADLQILLLRQRDPSGKTVPSDELELIAYSQMPPQRLAKTSEGAVYEQTIEVTIPAAGRYAIRIEGRVPTGVRPYGVPSLPAIEKGWELRPRIFVEALDQATRVQGRPVIYDFIAVPPGVGVPADARAARTVGTVNPDNRPAPYSAFGAGPGLEMLYKPNVLAYDFLPRYQTLPGPARGTSLSTAFAGGTAATLISAGAPQSWMLEALRIPPGHIFIVPDEWLRLR